MNVLPLFLHSPSCFNDCSLSRRSEREDFSGARDHLLSLPSVKSRMFEASESPGTTIRFSPTNVIRVSPASGLGLGPRCSHAKRDIYSITAKVFQ